MKRFLILHPIPVDYTVSLTHGRDKPKKPLDEG